MEYYEAIIACVVTAVVVALEYRRDHKDTSMTQRLVAIEHMVGNVYSPLLLFRVEQIESQLAANTAKGSE